MPFFEFQLPFAIRRNVPTSLLNSRVVSQSHYFSSQSLLTDERLARSSPLLTWVRGHRLQFFTSDGVFSKGALDAGTRLLLETIALTPDTNFCDLGCGWGAVSVLIAKEFPSARVYGVDVNARAVQLARHNLRHNEIASGAIWCGDGLGATRAEMFDCIACNPPIRAGNAVIDRLFDDAHSGLKAGGELWVVIRTAQGAKSWQAKLAARFGSCETMVMKNGYRVLKAVKGESE